MTEPKNDQEDFWNDRHTSHGRHRHPDQYGTRVYLRTFLRGPESLPKPLWYVALGLAAFAALVALWGLGTAIVAWLG